MNTQRLVLSIALCAAALAAQAQTVYRCGPDGRTYSDSPCKEGRAVDVADGRSAEQSRAAADAARRDQKEADSLRRERQAREAEGARRGMVALGPTALPASAPAAKSKKPSVPARKRPRKPVNPMPRKTGQAPA
jgi:hypothetical protein